MALLFNIDDERGAVWQALFAQHAPDLDIRLWSTLDDPRDIRWFASWQCPPDLYTRLPNLEVVFATSAGVDQFDPANMPDGVQLVRMLDPGIARGIVEYACMAVLSQHRDLPMYLDHQRAGQWQEQPLQPASQRRVGVMGLGNLGQAVLEALAPFGFQRRGWSRSLRQIDGVECYAGAGQLNAFLGQCDILLCLLPLTSDTQGILNASTFAALPHGARLINLGRGGHLVETDLLAALESGQLSHAVLDVLKEEPPAADHPFFHHPNIWLTPHIGAMTSPESAFEGLLENIRRYQRGEPMIGAVEREKGY